MFSRSVIVQLASGFIKPAVDMMANIVLLLSASSSSAVFVASSSWRTKYYTYMYVYSLLHNLILYYNMGVVHVSIVFMRFYLCHYVTIMPGQVSDNHLNYM